MVDPADQLRDAATTGRALRRQTLIIGLVLLLLVALTVGFILWVGHFFVDDHVAPTTSTTTTSAPAPTTSVPTIRPPAAPQRPSTAPTTETTRPSPSTTAAAPGPTQPPQTTTTTSRPACLVPLTVPLVCP